MVVAFVLFWSKNHYLSQNVALHSAMPFHLVYITNCVANYKGIKIYA